MLNSDLSPGASAPFRPGRAWATVGVLIILFVLSNADRQILAMLVDPIKADLRISDVQIGLLQGFAFFLLYAIAGIPLGWAVDRFSPRMIILMGVLLWSICTTACGLASGFWGLFWARVGLGVGEASLTPAAYAIMGRIFPKERLGLPTSAYMASATVGPGVSFLLSGLVVAELAQRAPLEAPVIGELQAWQSTFIILGLPGVFLAFLAFTLPRVTLGRVQPGLVAEPASPFLREHWVLLISHFIAFALMGACVGTMLYWGPASYARVFQWRPDQIGPAFGLLFAIGGTFFVVSAGAVADRLFARGVKDAHFRVALTTSAVGICLLFVGLLLPNGLWNFALAGLGSIILIAWTGTGGASLQLIAPPHLRGRLIAMLLFANSIIASGFGPLAVGAIAEHVLHDPRQINVAMAATVAIAGPLGLLLLTATLPRYRALVNKTLTQ